MTAAQSLQVSAWLRTRGGFLAPTTTAACACLGPGLPGLRTAHRTATGGRQEQFGATRRGSRQTDSSVPACDVALASRDGRSPDTDFSRGGDRPEPEVQALGAQSVAPP